MAWRSMSKYLSCVCVPVRVSVLYRVDSVYIVPFHSVLTRRYLQCLLGSTTHSLFSLCVRESSRGFMLSAILRCSLHVFASQGFRVLMPRFVFRVRSRLIYFSFNFFFFLQCSLFNSRVFICCLLVHLYGGSFGDCRCIVSATNLHRQTDT